MVPVHVHPSFGQTAAKASTSLRAALSGKACTEKPSLTSSFSDTCYGFRVLQILFSRGYTASLSSVISCTLQRLIEPSQMYMLGWLYNYTNDVGYNVTTIRFF